MMDGRLTEKAVKDLERSFQLNRDAWRLLDVIVAEFESDPRSVECFDLRTVDEAKSVVKEMRSLNVMGNPLRE